MRLGLDPGGGGTAAPAATSNPGRGSPSPAAVSRQLPAGLDPALAAAALTAAAGLTPFLTSGSPLMAAAAAAAANSMLLYGAPPTPYGLSLQAALSSSNSQAASGESVCNKNNSIAELRMKAKKYAAALGL